MDIYQKMSQKECIHSPEYWKNFTSELTRRREYLLRKGGYSAEQIRQDRSETMKIIESGMETIKG